MERSRDETMTSWRDVRSAGGGRRRAEAQSKKKAAQLQRMLPRRGGSTRLTPRGRKKKGRRVRLAGTNAGGGKHGKRVLQHRQRENLARLTKSELQAGSRSPARGGSSLSPQRYAMDEDEELSSSPRGSPHMAARGADGSPPRDTSLGEVLDLFAGVTADESRRDELEQNAVRGVFVGLFGAAALGGVFSCGGEMDSGLRDRILQHLQSHIFKAGPAAATTSPSAMLAWQEYLDQRVVQRLVQALCFEDRVAASPGLHVLRAMFQHMPESRPGIQRAAVETLISYAAGGAACAEAGEETAGGGVGVDASAAGDNEGELRQVSAPPLAYAARLLDLVHALVEEFAKDARDPELVSAGADRLAGMQARASVLARALATAASNRALMLCMVDRISASATLLVRACPAVCALLLSCMLRKWPSSCGALEAVLLEMVGQLLTGTPPGMLPAAAPRVHSQLLARLARSVSSPQAAVARAAVAVVAHPYVAGNLVGPFPAGRKVAEALFANKEHWSADLREQSEEAFDQLLDFA